MALANKSQAGKMTKKSRDLVGGHDELDEHECDMSFDGFFDGSSSMDSNNNKSSSSGSTKPKTPYKHIPHCLKPPEVVEKRNARERKRVRAVNEAFYKLRACVPIENRNKRVSKVKTLQRAIDYIRKLEIILESDDLDSEAAASLLNQAQQQQQRQQQRKTKQQNNNSKLNKSQKCANNAKTNSKTRATNNNKPIVPLACQQASSSTLNYPPEAPEAPETSTSTIQEHFNTSANTATSQHATSYLIEASPLVRYADQHEHQQHCSTLAITTSYNQQQQHSLYEDADSKQQQHLVQYGQPIDYIGQPLNSYVAESPMAHSYAQTIQVPGDQSSSSAYANQAQFQTASSNQNTTQLWRSPTTSTRTDHYSTPSPTQPAKQQSILASPLKITSSSNHNNKQGLIANGGGSAASPLSTSTNSSCSPRVDSTSTVNAAGTMLVHQKDRVAKLQLDGNSPLQIQPDSSSAIERRVNNNNNSMQKTAVCHSTGGLATPISHSDVSGGPANNLSGGQQHQRPLVELHHYDQRTGSSYASPNELIDHYPGVIHCGGSSGASYASQHYPQSNQQNHYQHHSSNYYVNEMHHQQQPHHQSLYVSEWHELHGIAAGNGLEQQQHHGGKNDEHQQQQFSSGQLTPTRTPENNLALLGNPNVHNNTNNNNNNDNNNDNNGSSMHQYYHHQPQQLHQQQHHHHNHHNHNQLHHETATAATGDQQQPQFQSQTNIILNDYCARQAPAII